MIEELAKELKDEIGRQWGAHPIPGDASPASWTAQGNVLDLEQCVRAILTRLREPTKEMVSKVAKDIWDRREALTMHETVKLAINGYIDAISPPLDRGRG